MTATRDAVGIEHPNHGDLDGIERRLIAEFDVHVPADVVRSLIADVASGFDDAQVRTYIPILVERIARDWLRDAVGQTG